MHRCECCAYRHLPSAVFVAPFKCGSYVPGRSLHVELGSRVRQRFGQTSVEPWDLHVGAKIRLLGRTLTLRRVSVDNNDTMQHSPMHTQPHADSHHSPWRAHMRACVHEASAEIHTKYTVACQVYSAACMGPHIVCVGYMATCRHVTRRQ